MTPEEKAKELSGKFYETMAYPDMSLNGKRAAYNQSKKCALIGVDEILTIAIYFTHEESEPDEATWEFWQQVKEEIQKI